MMNSHSGHLIEEMGSFHGIHSSTLTTETVNNRNLSQLAKSVEPLLFANRADLNAWNNSSKH